ncbi:hypothetical protein [Ancylobacter oerskovii]|uniref:Uncharacterized protein n=1 Tax=Ancylobacter oerskovii TaxID=459519 RepID=A0ABW4Z5H6_9HYPH
MIKVTRRRVLQGGVPLELEADIVRRADESGGDPPRLRMSASSRGHCQAEKTTSSVSLSSSTSKPTPRPTDGRPAALAAAMMHISGPLEEFEKLVVEPHRHPLRPAHTCLAKF